MKKLGFKLKMVESEPEVVLTPETMLLLIRIGEYIASVEGGFEDEIAQLAAALSVFRKALGGQGTFHTKEITDLVFCNDFFKGLAYCIAAGDVKVQYDEEKELVFRIKEKAGEA